MGLSDYLSDKTADYNYTLNIACYAMLPETGNKKQIIHEMDDGSVKVASMSAASWYDIEVDFFLQTTTDATVLFELYNNPNYANGSERTFYWTHPRDLTTYTVRFMSPVKRVHYSNYPNYIIIEPVTMRVEGTKP